jgi:hypothetical protein
MIRSGPVVVAILIRLPAGRQQTEKDFASMPDYQMKAL